MMTVLGILLLVLMGAVVLLLGLGIAEAIRIFRWRRRCRARRRLVVRRVTTRRGYRVELVPLTKGRGGDEL